MFKRSQKKKSSDKDQHQIRLFATDATLNLLSITQTNLSDLIHLEDDQFKKLVSYLTAKIDEIPVRLKLLEELKTTNKRERQLNETKKVVYSLRETDETSGTALSFLREKLDLLIEERKNLALKFLSFQEELKRPSTEPLQEQVQHFLSDIHFLETESWEDDLDYYRTRFLMQREQDEEDHKLKGGFIPDDDPVLDAELIDAFDTTKSSPRIMLYFSVSRKQHQNLKSLAKDYNIFMEKIPSKFTRDILELELTEIERNLAEQEKISFDTGKELYILKREQGILSLKIYEIIQTLRSRLLNISGSIATRKFMKDAFNELIEYLSDVNLSDDEKKAKLMQVVHRLLSMLSEIKPS